jgi:hypothetical protein
VISKSQGTCHTQRHGFRKQKNENQMALTRLDRLESAAYGVGDKVEREERSGSQTPGEERNVLAPPRRRPWFGSIRPRLYQSMGGTALAAQVHERYLLAPRAATDQAINSANGLICDDVYFIYT